MSRWDQGTWGTTYMPTPLSPLQLCSKRRIAPAASEMHTLAPLRQLLSTPLICTLLLRHIPHQTVQSLSRQVVKGDHATIRVPELEFEIPPDTQKGIMTTARRALRWSFAPADRTEALLGFRVLTPLPRARRWRASSPAPRRTCAPCRRSAAPLTRTSPQRSTPSA